MDNLLQGMIGNFSDDIVEKVAREVGVDPKTAQTVLNKMTPAMTGAMAKNAKTPEGAGKLANALNKHDGSIFDNLDSVMGGDLEQDGAKILGYVFGDKTQDVEQVIERETGGDKDSTMKMMSTFAPLILGALGKEKQAVGMDSETLSTMLGGAAKMMSKDGKNSGIMSMLDLDNDGSVIDDVPKILGFLGMAKKFLRGRKA